MLTRSLGILSVLFFAVLPVDDPVTGGAARLEAWGKRAELQNSSPFKDLQWRPLGPKFCGGRIEAVDCPPGSAGTIYAGVGAGGVFKTTNGGLSWKPIFHRESTYAVGDVEVSRARPELVWVGTGEAHLSGTSYEGTGVFKSTDGGASWNNMGLHDSAHIGKVVAHPSDPDIVYVAAIGAGHNPAGERGVYRSKDGGVTWERVLHVGERVGIIDLVMDPSNPARLWAASWQRGGGPGSGVHRSTDGGETWVKLGGGLPEGNRVGRVAVDVSVSDPSVVYALVVDHSPKGGGRGGVQGLLFRSGDGGDSWSQTHQDAVPTYVGWDFCDVRVAPDDANQVYLCGLRLLISSDGGKTFERGGENVQRLHDHQGSGMHLDMHDVWIDPERPERVLLGTDGGLYVSWDRAASWLHLNNLPIAEFYKVHLDGADPFQIWGGTQDNASLVAPSNVTLIPGGPDAWEQIFLDHWSGGDGFSSFPDPFDPSIVYWTQQQGDLRRGQSGELRRSKHVRPKGPGLRFAWDTPYMASPHTEGVLYCAAEGVHRSTDRGDSWEAIGPEPWGGSILSLSESLLDPKRLVTGAGGGRVQLTRDAGATWERAGDGLPSKRVTKVVTSVHDPELVYVALSGSSAGDRRSYVFRSEDFGATWKSLAGNLPNEPVTALIEDPSNPNVLYLGTDLGVFVSTDGGARWDVLGGGLPTCPVVDLAAHSASQTLVVVTHGLSAFALGISSLSNGEGK